MQEILESGARRVLYYQLNNAPIRGICQIKMGVVQKLNEKYDIDVDLFL